MNDARLIFTLSQCGVPKTGTVRMMRCGVRTRKMSVCASNEVVLCTPPVAFSELRLTGRETQLKKNQSGWRSDLLVLVDNNF